MLHLKQKKGGVVAKFFPTPFLLVDRSLKDQGRYAESQVQTSSLILTGKFNLEA